MTGFCEQAYSKGYALQKLGAKRIHSKQLARARSYRAACKTSASPYQSVVNRHPSQNRHSLWQNIVK
jgi:hypothetical protein